MVSYMDYTSPQTKFSFDMNKSRLFTKDQNNYINVLGTAQLNTLENMSLLDIFLSQTNVIEPHIHQNAAELVYCISGSAIVSMLNPFTKQIQNYRITPGKVANVPQGWWHYEVAEVDHTHLLAIFDAPTPEFVLGSDLLRLTPAHIMAHTYCLDENQWKNTVAPIKESTIIGPPKHCNQRETVQQPAHTSHAQMHQQPYQQHYYPQYYRGFY
ncbi:cupin domain-containing protein [Cytobacillus gottheilii]|uniref:cupin domain-containing protein n=1 Tax=Cytobacillus gottheilii TaxID=859144 RepID=UPI0009BB5BEF|nr:cupin domain-containing protein [Cytobacillus gottheilii]